MVVDGELEASYWPAVSSDSILALFLDSSAIFLLYLQEFRFPKRLKEV